MKSTVTPISHASLILNLGGKTVYADPVGEAALYQGQPAPDLIVITDTHGDHANPDTLKAVSTKDTVIVVPQAVADMLPKDMVGTVVVLKNGETTTQQGIEIEGIAVYNIPESDSSFHVKGRGNGYVLTADGERIYIAGDTSATPEMKALQNIDMAFVPMNMPYTMSEEEAAEGVLAFKPKVVHPYHYRGINGFSDVEKFKKLVEEKDPTIKVELLNFYPQSK